MRYCLFLHLKKLKLKKNTNQKRNCFTLFKISLLILFALTSSCKSTKRFQVPTVEAYEQEITKIFNSMDQEKLKSTYFSINIDQKNGMKFQISFDESIVSKVIDEYAGYAIYLTDTYQDVSVEPFLEHCKQSNEIEIKKLEMKPSDPIKSKDFQSGHLFVIPFNDDWKKLIQTSKCFFRDNQNPITINKVKYSDYH